MLQSKLEALGLQIHLSKATSSIGGEEKIDALHFGDGSVLPVDMLVISAGIRPRDELARLAGLDVGLRGGIVVNDEMRTSAASIFAIGECALHGGMIYGLVAPGYDMAEVVVSQLTQGARAFGGYDMSSKLKLIGVNVASFGDPFIAAPHSRSIVFEDAHRGVYKRINVSPDGKYLLGGVLIGDAEAYNMLLQTVNNKLALPPHPEDLMLGARGGEAAEGAGVMSLPDEALVCSCEAVTKGAICAAVTEQSITTVDAMKKCNKAGTGCGGCVPLLKDLINGTLTAQGAYIKNVLCEHFDYSRQELFDLLKINNIRTYDVALDHFGKGDGCETCKPALGSILAGLWNDLIVKQHNQWAWAMLTFKPVLFKN